MTNDDLECLINTTKTIILVTIWFFLVLITNATKANEYELKIKDTLIDVHSGPGRGFPIIHSLQQSDQAVALESKANWVKLSIYNTRAVKKTGWVERSKLVGSSIVVADQTFLWADEDKLNRAFELGFMAGEVESDPTIGVRGAWRISQFFSIEGSIYQVLQLGESDQVYKGTFQFHPFFEAIFSPYFEIGAGAIDFATAQTIDGVLAAELATVGLGLRTYLTRQFVLRFAFNNDVIFINDQTQRSDQQWHLGFSFMLGDVMNLASDQVLPELTNQDMELGIFSGIYNTDDFGSEGLLGFRAAYHVTEDFFIEADFAFSSVTPDEFNELDNSPINVRSGEADMSYFSIALGYKMLPGEIVLSKSIAWWHYFYVLIGAGATAIEEDDYHSYIFGAGYRVYPHDRVSVQFGMKQHYLELDLLGAPKSTENLSLELGISVAF